jgi:hypothetical protein
MHDVFVQQPCLELEAILGTYGQLQQAHMSLAMLFRPAMNA